MFYRILLAALAVTTPALAAEPKDIMDAFKPSRKAAAPAPAAPAAPMPPLPVDVKAAPKVKPALDGTWSRMATIGTLTGRWMTKAEQRQYLKEGDPDKFLRMFGPSTRQTVAALALETGFEVLREARDRAGEAVPVPEKDVEFVWRWQSTQGRDGTVYRAQIVIRVTKIKPPPPGAGAPAAGAVPPAGWP